MKRCKRCGLYPTDSGLNTCDTCIGAIQNLQVPFGAYAKEETGVRQLIRDLRRREPARESFRRWWTRERTGVTVGVLVVLCGWLGYQHVELNRVNTSQCRDITVIAHITSDTLANQIANTKALLPKLNFPGISHAELVRLTEISQERERRHLLKLEAVARGSC